MFQNRWIRWTSGLVLLVATNGLAFFAGTAMHKTPDCPPIEFYQKDGRVYAGVAMSDKLLSGDFTKDCETAKKRLSTQQRWVYIIGGPVPGLPGHTGFGFRALATDEDAPPMQ